MIIFYYTSVNRFSETEVVGMRHEASCGIQGNLREGCWITRGRREAGT